MEAIAAFSLVCNVLQIVEQSKKIIVTAREVRGSNTGSTCENEELMAINKRLQKDAQNLLCFEDDPLLRNMAESCMKLTAQHIATIDAMNLGQRRSSLRAVLSVLKTMLTRRRLEASQARLERLSLHIANHTVNTRVPSMDISIDHLISQQDTIGRRTTESLASMRQRLEHAIVLIENNLNTTTATQDSMQNLVESIQETEEQRNYRQCMHALNFPDLETRENEVKEAHRKTFEWIFEAPDDYPRKTHQSRFLSWLRSSDPERNVFWISGKPGSGKSTLMKFLAHHPSLEKQLSPWADRRPVLVVDYYFWRSGTLLQRSMKGLLRSLIFHILKQHPDLLDRAFPEAGWTMGGLPYEFPLDALYRAMRAIVEEISIRDLRLFLFVDGLDEFDDRSELDNTDDDVSSQRTLIDFLQTIYSSRHVKLCVSSRRLSIFRKHFGQHEERCIEVHKLTEDDIKAYIKDIIGKDEDFMRLAKDDVGYLALIDEMVEAAEGVFLWVKLASNSLLKGLMQDDEIGHLRKRLRGLPRELRAMYDHILSTIDRPYQEIAARSLLMAADPSTPKWSTFYLSLDDEERSEADLVERDCSNYVREVFNRSQRILGPRLGHLLDYNDQFPSPSTPEPSSDVTSSLSIDLHRHVVTPTHRTLVEYLRKDSIQAQLKCDADLRMDLNNLICNACSAGISTVLRQTALVENSGNRDIDTCRTLDKLYHNLVAEMYALVRFAELSQQQHALEHWSRLQSMNLAIIFDERTAFHRLITSLSITRTMPCIPSRLTTLDVAVVYGASNFVAYQLEHNPGLLKALPGGFPPLYFVTYSFTYYKSDMGQGLRIVRALLQHGANPNEPFNSTTPWKCLLAKTIQNPSPATDFNLAPIVWEFLKHGADVDTDCELVGIVARFKEIPESLLLPQEMAELSGSGSRTIRERFTKPFSLSTKAIVRLIMRYNDPPKGVDVSWASKLPDHEKAESVLRQVVKDLERAEELDSSH